LSNYLAQDDIQSLAKRDEQSYIKAMQEKELRDQRKEDEKLREQLKSKHMAYVGLSQQLQEKQVQKQM
jgi:hypothetical protein